MTESEIHIKLGDITREKTALYNEIDKLRTIEMSILKDLEKLRAGIGTKENPYGVKEFEKLLEDGSITAPIGIYVEFRGEPCAVIGFTDGFYELELVV